MVGHASRSVAHLQLPASASGKTETHLRHVVYLPARDQCSHLSGNRLKRLPRDKTREMMRVRADIAKNQ